MLRLILLSVSSTGPCMCQLVSLGNASRTASPLRQQCRRLLCRCLWLGWSVFCFSRSRELMALIFFNTILLVQSKQCLFWLMNMFLFSCFLAYCLVLHFYASRIKCFIQNRIFFVPVCGRCLERWGSWGDSSGFNFRSGGGGREKWPGLQKNCKEKASFVVLIALNSSDFPRTMVNPIYANPHLGSFRIFLEPLVWTEVEIGRYIILAKHDVPVEFAAKFLSNDVAHLTHGCWSLPSSTSCFSQFCLSLSVLLDIGLNSK